MGKVREQSQKFEKAKQAVAPDQPEEKNAVKVQSVSGGWDFCFSPAAGSFSEAFLEFTFVLVLTFFGADMERTPAQVAGAMFKQEDRRAATAR